MIVSIPPKEMSKQDLAREGWEEATRELRDFDRRLREVERLVRKSLEHEQEQIDEEGISISSIRERLDDARGRIGGAVKKGDEVVSEHPLLVMGGAFAAGILIGALVSRKSRSD